MESENSNRRVLHIDYHTANSYLMGDREAGRALYARAYPIIMNYIWKATANYPFSEQDKEDILQDSLLESKKKLERYNGSSAFSTFVTGIAKNKTLEKIRLNNKNVNLEEKLGILYIEPVTDDFDCGTYWKV
jgi:DNA-directed RNA polymerase specialized sigma24 family protein